MKWARCAGLLLLLAGVGCSVQGPAVVQGSQATPPSRTLPVPTSQPPEAQATDPTVRSPLPAPTQTLAITNTPPQPSFRPGPCEEETCTLPFRFPFSRPIPPSGRVTVDVSYRFGSNAQGQRETHHGVEFLNSAGTPVLAAADGEVVVAGDDRSVKYGLFLNFYGNLVVLEHTLPGFEQPVFTLYGHLSKVDVRAGDAVEGGQMIGEVGATGIATGSHLHFEVRYGKDTYAASRNPEMWLKPLRERGGEQMGALAGRILDRQGKPVEVDNIVVERVSDDASLPGEVVYLNTYTEAGLVGQEPWQDSFAAGDLPAGEYEISFYASGMQTRAVEVRPGKLTLVTFRIGEE